VTEPARLHQRRLQFSLRVQKYGHRQCQRTGESNGQGRTVLVEQFISSKKEKVLFQRSTSPQPKPPVCSSMLFSKTKSKIQDQIPGGGKFGLGETLQTKPTIYHLSVDVPRVHIRPVLQQQRSHLTHSKLVN
jgi:hypothetical protein